jgi:hypothetical protein
MFMMRQGHLHCRCFIISPDGQEEQGNELETIIEYGIDCEHISVRPVITSSVKDVCPSADVLLTSVKIELFLHLFPYSVELADLLYDLLIEWEHIL